MFARYVRAILLALLLNIDDSSGVRAADSFLSDHIIRKDQVQNVLEHQPAKQPACKHIVRIITSDFQLSPAKASTGSSLLVQ